MTGSLDKVEAARLHANGLNDVEIAKRLGVAKPTVRRWRVLSALPANAAQGGRVGPCPAKTIARGCNLIDSDRAATLYREGHSDRSAAAVVGCSDDAFRRWRIANDLAAVFHPGHPRRRPKPRAIPPISPMRDPLYALARRAIGYGLSRDIADDAASDLVVALLEGRIVEADVEREARRFRNRTISAFASRYGPASLDEDRNGEGWTRMASTPDPDAESGYRLVELCALASRMGLDPVAIIGTDA